MTSAYILGAARTPIGKFLGGLSHLPATELGAIAVREALGRTGIEATDVDEVIMGNVLSAGLGQAPARQAALQAGLPATVAALTINKVCGSGLKAVMLADQTVRLGEANVVIAGGMESMSRAPRLLSGSRTGSKLGDVPLSDSMLRDGLWCAFEDCHMGAHAEYTAENFGIARAEMDAYAVESQHRAARAIVDGAFTEEIVLIESSKRGSTERIVCDEGPRPGTTLQELAQLKPAFSDTGGVTAGNASMLSDGAAAVVVANRDIAERFPTPWKARIVAGHTSGVEPRDLFIAPVSAIRGVLDKAGLSIDDIDLFEINEAFAAQMLACLRELRLDPEKVNVNGGAIALGHPIGVSGARVLVTLLAALKHRGLKRGLASLCLGGGNAVALIVEFDA